ncbi:MAG TPA: hypothetical protein VFV72_11870 [Candidatus Limnocylindrales bacterium]|nr:hypothetical protein [Candidatus Limnocylindrales bacterium]
MSSSPRRASASPIRSVASWGVFALALAIAILSLVLLGTSIIGGIGYIAIPLSFAGIGAFLSTRVPDNPIGPMLLLAALGFTALVAMFTWLPVAVALPTTDPVAIAVGLLGNLLFLPALVLVLVGVPLVFPDGHLLSPRWRWVAIGSAAVITVAEVRTIFATRELLQVSGLLVNPFYVPGLDETFAAIDGLETLVGLPLFILAVWSLVLRYRRSDDVGRHQIKWFAAASAFAVTAYGFSFVTGDDTRTVFENIGTIALNTIPIAIGVAIFRYRLYEIDRIISRGISYALVSIVLLGAYAGAVLLLQRPIGELFGSQTITVALSTLVVAGLFQPVRSRIQRAVDRRFNRTRVDAQRTTAAFSDRLRDEVDIDAVLADLAATARDAVSPASMQLWLRDGSPAPAAERPT